LALGAKNADAVGFKLVGPAANKPADLATVIAANNLA
jgi:hypothetical protein